MCVAIPMEILQLNADQTAVVSSDEGTLSVNVSLIENPVPGDYVIVHAGFAIQKVDADEAREALDLFEEIRRMENEG